MGDIGRNGDAFGAASRDDGPTAYGHPPRHTAAPWTKPKFNQVELVIVWERDCEQRVMLGSRLLTRFSNHMGILQRSCGSPTPVRFIKKEK